METELRREAKHYNGCPHSQLKPSVSPLVPCNGLFLIGQISLRILAVVFTAIAIVLLLTSSQTFLEFGQVMTSSYTYSSAFRFKLGVDVAVCAFSLLSLFMVFAMRRPTANPHNYFYLLMHDTVMTLLTASGCSAATAIGYLAIYGQIESNWSPVCHNVTKFCHKVILSTVSSYMALACYGLLYFMAAYKLKSLALNQP